QEIVVTLEQPLAAGELRPAELILIVAQTLDLGAHGAVEDEDALFHGGCESGQNLDAIHRAGREPDSFSGDFIHALTPSPPPRAVRQVEAGISHASINNSFPDPSSTFNPIQASLVPAITGASGPFSRASPAPPPWGHR